MTVPYSTWRQAGGVYYISGQLPIAPEGGPAPLGMEGQAKAALANLDRVLSQIGCTRADVVKTTVFIRDLSQFKEFNDVYGEFFTAPYPARSAVEVSGLAFEADVEIEAIAVKER